MNVGGVASSHLPGPCGDLPGLGRLRSTLLVERTRRHSWSIEGMATTHSVQVPEQTTSAEGRYVYTVLRYVHDNVTAEFINVGVVVASCDAPCVAAKFSTACGRVQGAFPSLDTRVFLARMRRLQTCFDLIDAARCTGLRAREGRSITRLIRRVLPMEDSALSWSPAASGTGGPLAVTLELLYERFILRHDFRRGLP